MSRPTRATRALIGSTYEENAPASFSFGPDWNEVAEGLRARAAHLEN
ncbi:hypothetical protein [Streptomyces atroolivaceus]